MELSGASLYGDPCGECGWTWSITPEAAVDLVRDLPGALQAALADASGLERHPDLSWSVTGYVCHVADNLRAWAERVAGVLDGAEPAVDGYDPDHLAAARRYGSISLPAAQWSLRQSVACWTSVLDEALTRRIDLEHRTRGRQTAGDIARNNAHDAHHHRWDIERTLAASGRL